MPSLQALGEFKSSFNNIGGELRTLAELDIPADDLRLPAHEPASGPLAPSAGAAPNTPHPLSNAPDQEQFETLPELLDAEGDASGTDFINFGDLGDLLGGADNSIGSDAKVTDEEGLEFGSFIDTIPDDLDPEESSSPTEDNGLPPGLLNGLADELETAESTLSVGEDDFGEIEEAAADDSAESTLSEAEDLADLDFGDADFSGGDTASKLEELAARFYRMTAARLIIKTV
jgi:hypothetical protein